MGRFTPGPTKDPNYVGLADLKTRGWSATMIETILGDPDRLVKNPRYRKAAPMRFFALARVEAIEASPVFAARQAKAAKRSAVMTVSAGKRIAELVEQVEAMTISVRSLPLEDLPRVALEHFHRRQQRGRAERQSVGESPAAFQRRIVVNYIRHNLTTYDEALDETAARVGATAARERIRQRVYGAIAAAYPHLDRECQRQMKHRGVATESPVPLAAATLPFTAP